MGEGTRLFLGIAFIYSPNELGGCLILSQKSCPILFTSLVLFLIFEDDTLSLFFLIPVLLIERDVEETQVTARVYHSKLLG